MGMRSVQGLPIDIVRTLHDEELLALDAFCACQAGQLAKRMAQTRLHGWTRFVEETQALNERLHTEQGRRLFLAAGVPPKYQGITLAAVMQDMGKLKGKLPAIQTVSQFVLGRGTFTLPNDPLPYYGLWLSGAFGVGKTTLAAACFNELLEVLGGGLWLNYKQFLERIVAGYKDGTANERKEAAMTTPLLVIDDFGNVEADEETAHTKRIMLQVVDHRNAHFLPMIVTSNLTKLDMMDRFESSTFQRMAEMLCAVNVGGECLRKLR